MRNTESIGHSSLLKMITFNFSARLRNSIFGCLLFWAVLLCFSHPVLAGAEETPAWSFETGGPIKSSPAIGTDGMVYVQSSDGSLYAIKPDGNVKWSVGIEGHPNLSPAVGDDGTAYSAGAGNLLHAINHDGTPKWFIDIGGAPTSSPAMGADGSVIITEGANILSINPDGTHKWIFSPGSRIQAVPAIGKDGMVYAVTENAVLYAIDGYGIARWCFELKSKQMNCSSTLDPDNTIFILFDRILYAVNTTGCIQWSLDKILSSSAPGTDGIVYVTADSRICAAGFNGTLKWSFPISDRLDSAPPPAVGFDGRIYLGRRDGRIDAIGLDGNQVGFFDLHQQIDAPGVVGPDGTLYVGSEDSRLYAIKSRSSTKPELAGQERESPIPGITGSAASWTGAVRGVLHQNSATGPVLAGVTVTCGGKTTTTSSTGAYVLTGIWQGRQVLSFSRNGFQEKSRLILITAGQTLNAGNDFLVKTPTGTARGVLHRNSATGAALAGATVTCGGKTTTTSSTGAYSLTGIPEGRQVLSFSRNGFQGKCKWVLIPARQTLNAGNDFLVSAATNYLTLVKQISTKYRAKAGTTISDKIDATVRPPAKATAGADLAAFFLSAGAGSAAIYSAAWSAMKNPNDAIAANTLAVALDGMGDSDSALKILLYADGIKPNLPVIALDLGWVYLHKGNIKNATLYFNKALALSPGLSSAKLGLGLIAESQGHHKTAQTNLIAALTTSVSAFGASQLHAAEQAISDSGGAERTDPISNKTASDSTTVIPPIQIASGISGQDSLSSIASSAQKFENAYARLNNSISTASQEFEALAIKVNEEAQSMVQINTDGIKEYFMFDKEHFLMTDIQDIINHKSTILVNAYMDWWATENENYMQADSTLINQETAEIYACNYDETCEAQVRYKYCMKKNNLGKTHFLADANKIASTSKSMASVLTKFSALARPIIKKIQWPTLNQFENKFLQLNTLNLYYFLSAAAKNCTEGALNLVNSLYLCVPPPEPDTSATDDPSIGRSATKWCPFKDAPLKLNLIVFSYELACDHVKIGGTYNFITGSIKRDFLKHQTEVFIGAGAVVSYGNGAIGGNAAVGVVFTVAAGQVQDIGLSSTVSTSLGGVYSASVNGRIGVNSGPSITGPF
ncbi:PQQ-binding-like beta-propeller repeat protein [Syntrophobacter fumaroxidans]|uniref:PQQ-binding-like beta-propeller repeat protein n=1 Tax=Syntrophobacter fumaroxidans TaxID=119484 RepID=UPI00005735EE|nr:PQQ-binding-like beta-propeller repeat protein [Syntrophobacter fumaroxidans]